MHPHAAVDERARVVRMRGGGDVVALPGRTVALFLQPLHTCGARFRRWQLASMKSGHDLKQPGELFRWMFRNPLKAALWHSSKRVLLVAVDAA